MERIIAAGCSDEQLYILKRAASDMRLRLQTIDDGYENSTLEELIDGSACKCAAGNERTDISRNSVYGSLVIFCDLTDKHLDHVLARLKDNRAGIDYKAVLTPTNRKWTLKHMYINMEMEKRQLENGE